jgi:hypothetical protein
LFQLPCGEVEFKKKEGPMGVVEVITWLLKEEHQLT